MTQEVQVHNTVEKNKKIADGEILLDNQAYISIIQPKLVHQVKANSVRRTTASGW